jgi:hypothetical protein
VESCQFFLLNDVKFFGGVKTFLANPDWLSDIPYLFDGLYGRKWQSKPYAELAARIKPLEQES